MEEQVNLLKSWLINIGVPANYANIINITLILIIIISAGIIADKVTRRVIITTISQFVKRSKNKWDDILLEKNIFNRLAHLAPALVVHFSISLALSDFPQLVNAIQTVIYIYITIITTSVLLSFTKALNDIYTHSPISNNRPIKGYLQLANIFFVIIAILLIYSTLTGNEIKGVLAGLGAMAAILMLVFKDTILGLTASIQLSANDMVKIGDWISMPSHKADGTVLEISLNTVKVQNWDKTISTIPTYALVSESFSNWRGMEESGGRRIKRSINLDMRSVQFCSNDMLSKFSKIQYLKNYVTNKSEELQNYNTEHKIDDSVKVNGRRLTNLGIFRKYIEEYLLDHPKIHNDMTFLVRQLQPTEKGIPMEIYVFSNDQEWGNYEALQSDIFDHILAIIPEFELKVFQNPTGYDFEKLSN